MAVAVKELKLSGVELDGGDDVDGGGTTGSLGTAGTSGGRASALAATVRALWDEVDTMARVCNHDNVVQVRCCLVVAASSSIAAAG